MKFISIASLFTAAVLVSGVGTFVDGKSSKSPSRRSKTPKPIPEPTPAPIPEPTPNIFATPEPTSYILPPTDPDPMDPPPLKRVLIVVDMENSYCSAEACPEFNVTDDGPEFDYFPQDWIGTGCGAPCTTDGECITAAYNRITNQVTKKRHKFTPAWNKSVYDEMFCAQAKGEEMGKCHCDSTPGESVVISRIANIIKAKKDGKSVWDHFLFTHDWNEYQDPRWMNASLPYPPYLKKQYETQTLIAWTKGSEIVQELAKAIADVFEDEDKNGDVFPSKAIIQNAKVSHFVKQHANWGYAKHQDMRTRTQKQGQYLPLYLKETILRTGPDDNGYGLFDPKDVEVTIVGSFSQYCVLSGALTMMLSGYNKITVVAPASGGYKDYQSLPVSTDIGVDGHPLCSPDGFLLEEGSPTKIWHDMDDSTISCPRAFPHKKASLIDKTNWMAATAGGEGDNTGRGRFGNEYDYSAEIVQTTKDIALGWLEDLGATVPKEWPEYIKMMKKQGITVEEKI